MALTEAFTGTRTAHEAAEHSLVDGTTGTGTETTDGIYQLFIDFSNLTAGDEYRVRIYEQVRITDPQRLVYQSNLVGPQSPPIWVCPTLILLNGWDMTLTKIAGVDRTITWSIRRVG